MEAYSSIKDRLLRVELAVRDSRRESALVTILFSWLRDQQNSFDPVDLIVFLEDKFKRD